MVMLNKKFYGFATAAFATVALASCSNELNEGDLGNNSYPNGSGISLVKSPDVVAWSGNQVLGKEISYSTRSNVEYDWNFPAEMFKAESFEVPSEALDYTGNYQPSGVYRVKAGEYITSSDWDPGLKFDNNVNLTVYVESGAKVKNIGSNIRSIDLYIAEGAEVTIANYSMNNCNIYNAGVLNLPKGFDGNKIQNIYTIGSVYVGMEDEWGTTLPSDVSIYNKGGYVEFRSKIDNSNPYYYSQTLINGTIISDNIVKSKGIIKFQSNGYRDICKLISTDLIDITDSTNIFGEIEGVNIKFDGALITLHPEGYIYASDEINIPNSGCIIRAFDSKSRGLVECNTLNINLTNDPLATAIGEGIYLQTNALYNQANGETFTDLSGFSVASSDHINKGVSVNPSCTALSDENPEEQPGSENNSHVYHDDEVEVNYAILDEHPTIGDLVTKLSIHVRHVTNVEIKIPIPTKYIIESDDLYIFNEHYGKPGGEYEGAYGEGTLTENPLANQFAVLTYPVENAGIVTLHVDFEKGDLTLGSDFEQGYIRIWTEGINQAVIDACRDNYQDGINFEIFNYFDINSLNGLTREQLKGFMDKSIITFLDSAPSYYINAFGFEDNGEYDENDEIVPMNHEHATVVPSGGYKDPYSRTHLNSTPYNDIYVHERVAVADDLHREE